MARTAGGAYGILISLILFGYSAASGSLFGATQGIYSLILFIAIPLATAIAGISFAAREALDAYIMTELVDRFRGEVTERGPDLKINPDKPSTGSGEATGTTPSAEP